MRVSPAGQHRHGAPAFLPSAQPGPAAMGPCLLPAAELQASAKAVSTQADLRTRGGARTHVTPDKRGGAHLGCSAGVAAPSEECGAF